MDISKSPADSTNGRFHALGFTKRHEAGKFRPVHVFTRGNEVYRTGNVQSADKLLLNLESVK
jgi:hypothetical protein